MSAPLLDDIDRLLEQARERQYARLGRESLLWLALVPEWTDDLADACGFPLPEGEALATFLERATQAGLCDARLGMGRAGARRTFFHMPESAREEFLAAERVHDRRLVAATAVEVAERILGARERVEIPLAIEHWANLAAGARTAPGAMGDSVTRRVRELTREDDTGAALDWLAAAEGLAPVFGGELASAVTRGKHRVNLEYRRRQDERMLVRFVRREEQIRAILDLLDGPDDQWALHLIGMGGVGKTMLIRYVGSLLAREHQRSSFPVGRIDFDHINPSFPFERPAELLLVLGDSLAPYAQTTELEAAHDAFVERVRVADEVAEGAWLPPLERIASEPVQDALDAFGAFLGQLPKPVLLVLDTCEELAKLYPAATTVPSVEAMWALLEGIAGRVDGARVLLAGRRLLATAGAGWRYDDATEQPTSLLSLGERPYLRLHELRGFDRDEALALLTQAAEPRGATVAAVLREAAETGRVPGVPGGTDGTSPHRFNPFDLALYADWLKESPDLSPRDIAGGETGAYIEARVVRRLHDPAAEAALPAVAVLGRFDPDMIAPVLNGDARERERIIAFLAEQEWVDVSSAGGRDGDEGDPLVIEVEPQLLPRLRRYFETGGRADAGLDAAAALAPHLERLLHEPVRPVTMDRADAALRLLPAKAGATAWAVLERRVCEESAWAWAVRACERLLADDELTGTPRHPRIRAHLRATFLAAVGHVESGLPPDPAGWALVLEEVSAHPDVRIVRWLRMRATARLAALNASGAAGDEQLVRALHDHERRGWWDEQAIAADIAALEAMLDAGVAGAGPRTTALLAAWVDTLPTEDPELLAGAHLAVARAAGWPAARHRFERADGDARGVDPAQQRWLDWLAPSAIRERVRLWWLVAELAAGDWTSLPLDGWLRDATEDARRIGTDDAERLAALMVDLAPRLLAGEVLDRLTETALAARPPGRARSPVHLKAPALVKPLARGLLSAARAEEALELVRRAERQAAAARGATESARQAARDSRLHLLWLVRRMRVAEDAAPLIQRLSAARTFTAEEREALLTAEALVLGPATPRIREDDDPHAAWRALAARVDAALRDESAAAVRAAFAEARGARRIALALDLCEAALMAGRAPGAEIGEAAGEWRALAAADAPLLDTEWQRLALREWALLAAGDAPPPAELPEREPRIVGDLALEEGELLALRLPAHACRLLDLATTRFTRGGDDPAALIAQVAAVLGRFRSGDARGARRLLDGRVRIAYSRLCARVPELPSWDEGLAGESPAAWAGWVTRLRIGRAWAEGRVVGAAGPAELDPVEGMASPEEPIAAPEPTGRTGLSLLRLGLIARRFGTFRAEIDLVGEVPWASVRLVSRGRGWVLREAKQPVPATGAPEPGGPAMALLRGTRRGSPQAVPGLVLRVDPALDRHPWEARLLMAPEPPPNLRTLDTWRRPRTLDPDVVPSSGPHGRVMVVGPDRWLLLAEEAWSAGGAERIGSRVADAGLQTVSAGDHGVLHLIGSAAETSGGWRLRFAEQGRLRPVGGDAGASADVLLAPEAVRGARAAAIVLQGTPGPVTTDADGLRGFAGAIMAGGAYLVLVVPTLPPDVAAAAITAVAPLLRDEALGFAAVLAAARDARAAVLDGLGGGPDAARVSLDVCLFAHHGEDPA